jgi:glycosyltransferase involved in cell wall biosynthesis
VNIGLVKRHVFYQKFFTFFADEITVVSPDTRESYRKLGAGQREVHLVPNGVRFAENPAGGPWTRALKLKARDAALESLTDQANVSVLKSLFDSHWILYMARVHGRKGQDQAMKLWKEMKPEVRRKTALIFLGLTTDPEQLKKLCALIEVAPDRDRMIYLGPSQSPGLWLRASEVFLSSSEFEGMPMASIEASGSGLSLVLSAIPGHESLLGKSFQYPLDHPEVGAKAVEEVISAIETEGDRFFASTWSASESIRNRYSVLQMATMYSKLYPKKG